MTERESRRLWSTTALTNGSVDPSVNFAENQLPSTVNNSARAVMAALARDFKDTNGSLDTTGTADAFLLTINNTWTAYATGQAVAFRAHTTCNAGATLNVTPSGGSALGAKYLLIGDGAAVLFASIVAGENYLCQYRADALSGVGGWVVLNTERKLIHGPFYVKPNFPASADNLFEIGPGSADNTTSMTGFAKGGTTASPAAITVGTEIGFLQYYGWDGTAYVDPSGGPLALVCIATQNWNGSQAGAGWLFQSTSAGTRAGQGEVHIQDGLVALKSGDIPANFPGKGLGTIWAKNGLYTGVAGSVAGTLICYNATSGSITVSPPTGALGTVNLTLPAATDTLVGKATTDTLTNKTYDTAGTGNSFSINGLAATANTGTGSVVRATSPALVMPLLGAATGTSLALGGALASAGILSLTGTGFDAIITTTQSDGATSTTGTSGIEVKSDVVDAFLLANGTARTTSRYGLTIGGYGELTLAVGTNGLIIGTSSNAPLLLGANNAIRATISTAGALRLHNYTTAGLIQNDTSGNLTSLQGTDGQLVVAQTSAAPLFKSITGDWTLSAAGAATLATVNSNVGTFGSATQASQVTVNGKGLVTAVANVTVTPAVGSITGLGTGVASFLATPSSANFATMITDESGTAGTVVLSASPTFTGTITAAAANFSGTITFGTGTITGLTNKASPNSTDDYVIIYDAAGTAIKKATVGSVGAAGAVASIAGNTGVFTLSQGITNATNDIRADWSFFQNYLTGLGLTYASTTTFTVAAGVAADSTNAAGLKLTSALTKSTSAWAVGNNNGGIDTGSVANSTWYHVWLIRRSDTGVVDVLFSTSVSAPTMPTNYDQKRRIGSVKTNGSAQFVQWVQNGDNFTWSAPVSDIVVTNPGTSAVTRTLTVPTGVIVEAIISVIGIGANGGASDPLGILISNLATTDTAVDRSNGIATIALYNTTITIETDGGSMTRVCTNTSAQVRSRLEASTADTYLRIGTFGWVDRRGRDG